jgi:GTPase SAR1 family protein
VTELRSLVDANLPIVIVANKFDLSSRRVVEREEIEKYAELIGSSDKLEITQELLVFLATNSVKSRVFWIECSAKSGKGVENAFLGLTYLMMMNEKEEVAVVGESAHKSNRDLPLKGSSAGSLRQKNSKRNLVILELEQQSPTEATFNAGTSNSGGREQKKCCVIQ